MKKFLCTALIPAFLISCNGDQSTSSNTSDASSISADTSAARMDAKDNSTNKMENDTSKMVTASNRTVTAKDVVDFVHEAGTGGMMEVELGNYAALHAQSQRVKDFGTMMATDHTAANNELKSMAMSNSIEVPAALKADQQMHVDMLKKKSGKDFDKAYMDMMVNDHKTDISEFKKASGNLSDASYKAFAMKTLPVLEKHLDSAQAIHKSM
ncbi:MAG: DUF4142 domain-containing protein [Ferruginibacter sp.]